MLQILLLELSTVSFSNLCFSAHLKYRDLCTIHLPLSICTRFKQNYEVLLEEFCSIWYLTAIFPSFKC